jgi:hypothetical protein
MKLIAPLISPLTQSNTKPNYGYDCPKTKYDKEAKYPLYLPPLMASFTTSLFFRHNEQFCTIHWRMP